MEIRNKGQSKRLQHQQEKGGGPLTIFGDEARKHDGSIGLAMEDALLALKRSFPESEFRHRSSISKTEVNEKLLSLDSSLGRVLFVQKSSIKPDGGIIEVMDGSGEYRIVLVSESKHQGNDAEKLRLGIKQGKNKDQDLMVAGNAIERVHKNILEFRNYMIDEVHFPYVVFLQGSNFATKTFHVRSPDGRRVAIAHNAGNMNRIDRVTASSFGMEINKNYCRNSYVELSGNKQMLQAASLYFQADSWSIEDMTEILWEVASTSMEILSDALPSKNRE